MKWHQGNRLLFGKKSQYHGPYWNSNKNNKLKSKQIIIPFFSHFHFLHNQPTNGNAGIPLLNFTARGGAGSHLSNNRNFVVPSLQCHHPVHSLSNHQYLTMNHKFAGLLALLLCVTLHCASAQDVSKKGLIAVDADGNLVLTPSTNKSVLIGGIDLMAVLTNLSTRLTSSDDAQSSSTQLISQLQSTVTTLNSSLETIKSTNLVLQSKLSVTEASLSTAQSIISSIQVNYSNMGTQLSTTQASLATTQSNLSNAQATLSTLASNQASTDALVSNILEVKNGSVYITAKDQILFVSQSKTFQVAQNSTSWNPSTLVVNVGDTINFTWPSSSFDAVAWVSADQTTIIASSGAPTLGGSYSFKVTQPGNLLYRSANQGHLLRVFAQAVGVERFGLIESTRAGSIQPYAGKSIPSGWLLCDGRQVLIAAYPTLFQAIGTSFGGDGITSFSLPDLSGRTVIGTSAKYKFGTVVGAESHVLTPAEMPAHTHNVNDPGHSHDGTTGPGPSATQQGSFTGATSPNVSGPRFISDTHTHDFITHSATSGIGIAVTGGGVAHNNMQPSMPLSYIIKT